MGSLEDRDIVDAFTNLVDWKNRSDHFKTLYSEFEKFADAKMLALIADGAGDGDDQKIRRAIATWNHYSHGLVDEHIDSMPSSYIEAGVVTRAEMKSLILSVAARYDADFSAVAAAGHP